MKMNIWLWIAAILGIGLIVYKNRYKWGIMTDPDEFKGGGRGFRASSSKKRASCSCTTKSGHSYESWICPCPKYDDGSTLREGNCTCNVCDQPTDFSGGACPCKDLPCDRSSISKKESVKKVF